MPEHVQQKLTTLENAKPQFDTIMTFDADSLSHMPSFLNFLEPAIQAGTVKINFHFSNVDSDLHKNMLLDFHQWSGLPFWAILAGMCITVRASLFPLIFVQMKKFTKFSIVSEIDNSHLIGHAHYLEFEGDQRQSHYPEKRIPENSQGKALFCVGDQGSEEKLGKK